MEDNNMNIIEHQNEDKENQPIHDAVHQTVDPKAPPKGRPTPKAARSSRHRNQNQKGGGAVTKKTPIVTSTRLMRYSGSHRAFLKENDAYHAEGPFVTTVLYDNYGLLLDENGRALDGKSRSINNKETGSLVNGKPTVMVPRGSPVLPQALGMSPTVMVPRGSPVSPQAFGMLSSMGMVPEDGLVNITTEEKSISPMGFGSRVPRFSPTIPSKEMGVKGLSPKVTSSKVKSPRVVLTGHIFTPDDSLSPIVNRVAPIVNRVSSTVNRVSPIVNRVSPTVNRVSPIANRVSPIVKSISPSAKVVPTIVNDGKEYSTGNKSWKMGSAVTVRPRRYSRLDGRCEMSNIRGVGNLQTVGEIDITVDDGTIDTAIVVEGKYVPVETPSFGGYEKPRFGNATISDTSITTLNEYHYNELVKSMDKIPSADCTRKLFSSLLDVEKTPSVEELLDGRLERDDSSEFTTLWPDGPELKPSQENPKTLSQNSGEMQNSQVCQGMGLRQCQVVGQGIMGSCIPYKKLVGVTWNGAPLYENIGVEQKIASVISNGDIVTSTGDIVTGDMTSNGDIVTGGMTSSGDNVNYNAGRDSNGNTYTMGKVVRDPISHDFFGDGYREETRTIFHGYRGGDDDLHVAERVGDRFYDGENEIAIDGDVYRVKEDQSLIGNLTEEEWPHMILMQSDEPYRVGEMIETPHGDPKLASQEYCKLTSQEQSKSAVHAQPESTRTACTTAGGSVCPDITPRGIITPQSLDDRAPIRERTSSMANFCPSRIEERYHIHKAVRHFESYYEKCCRDEGLPAKDGELTKDEIERGTVQEAYSSDQPVQLLVSPRTSLKRMISRNETERLSDEQIQKISNDKCIENLHYVQPYDLKHPHNLHYVQASSFCHYWVEKQRYDEKLGDRFRVYDTISLPKNLNDILIPKLSNFLQLTEGMVLPTGMGHQICEQIVKDNLIEIRDGIIRKRRHDYYEEISGKLVELGHF